MRTLSLTLATALAALHLSAARAEDAPPPAGLIALLPLAPHPQPDIDSFLDAHWHEYYQSGHPQQFTREQVRAGRYDLDGDGAAELLLLIESKDWEDEAGRPLVVASWRNQAWHAIGWGRGDEDGLFVTVETVKGWRTLDTGTQLLRWNGKAYGLVERTMP